MKLFKGPLKINDAAGRRYTVLFLKQVSPASVNAFVSGPGLRETTTVEILEQPVLNWNYYARVALNQVVKKKYGAEPTRAVNP